jgi:hypothetical protein
LFMEEDIPWETLAFPVVCETLRLFFKDRRAGKFKVHTGDIIRWPDRQFEINID